jgi:hypothetical protein
MKAGWLGAWVDAGDPLEVKIGTKKPCTGRMGAVHKPNHGAQRSKNFCYCATAIFPGSRWIYRRVTQTALRRISAQHWHRFHETGGAARQRPGCAHPHPDGGGREGKGGWQAALALKFHSAAASRVACNGHHGSTL